MLKIGCDPCGVVEWKESPVVLCICFSPEQLTGTCTVGFDGTWHGYAANCVCAAPGAGGEALLILHRLLVCVWHYQERALRPGKANAASSSMEAFRGATVCAHPECDSQRRLS